MADTFDVIMAAYPSVGPARQDFDGLVRLVKDKTVRTEGVILVEHDEDGEVRVTETGDHLGRKGLGWGGGVGVVVGLFSPPLLASAVVGAAAGGVAGVFARHRVESGIQTGIGEQLPPGSAGIIAVVNHADLLTAERGLPASPMKSVAQLEHHSLGALKQALATAAGKFSPDRAVLPIPDPSFGGTIGRTLAQSQADWTINMTPSPPDGAPNVLLVLIDDAGFGNPSTFGGPVDTPAMSRVAQAGLSYDRFHVTALCSPTRAAMLTGRNHHSVGFGSIGELPGPFPGYTAARPKDCAPFVRMLQGNGYSTAGFGKWHMTPDHVQGAAGPFDRWPNSWGFDHFWGFLAGESGQYDPVITQDNTIIGVPEGKDGQEYYLPDDLTDKAAGWLHAVRAQDPGKPWFLYYSTGCSHAPHQVPAEWSDKYRGRFDDGWDAYREQTFARQKQLGVIPGNAELTPRPAALPAWDSLSAEEKKLYARQMEVYAGFQENADWNVGRLLDAIEEMGELDDTLVIYIWGDNGASMEGTLTGSFNELTMQNGVPLTPAQQLSLIEHHGGLSAWGSDATAPHYASAWAWAGNCPFPWGKQVASHLGGTRDGMVIAWPRRIKDGGGRRSQFTHCIDIGPTILEAAGIPEATVVDGVEQRPMEGTSFLTHSRTPTAAERHTQQYFEIYANRAMYKDGWWACSMLDRIPWDITPATIARFAPGVYDPGEGRLGAVLPARRLLAGPQHRRGTPGQARRAQGTVLAGRPEVPGAAAAGWLLGVLRDPAADAHHHQADLLRRRAERLVGHDPQDLRPLLRDHRRASGPAGGSAGRHRRERRRDGRLLPVREGRQAQAHLQHDGRRDLPPGVDGAAARRRRERAHAVRRRRVQAGHRRHRDPLGQRPQDRRGTHRQDGPRPLLGLQRDGHRPRQRPAGRPQSVRRQVTVPLHGKREEGRVRPGAGPEGARPQGGPRGSPPHGCGARGQRMKGAVADHASPLALHAIAAGYYPVRGMPVPQAEAHPPAWGDARPLLAPIAGPGCCAWPAQE